MVTEKKLQESKTFLEKKGTTYAIEYATPEEREYFEGVLYNKGFPSFHLLSYLSIHVYNLLTP